MYHRQQQAAAASGGVDGEAQVTISRVGSKNHRKSKDGKTLEELYEQESLGFGGGPLQGQGSVIQGPSQQPRFLKLKPPVQMKIQDGESNEGGVGVVQQPLVPDASSFLPPGVEHLVSVDSNQNKGAIPPGTSESHVANLIGYENFGYVPQGVDLPRSNVVGSLKRSAEDGEAEAEGGSSKKRSKGDGFDLSPVKDLNNLGPSGGSFKAANRPKSNGNQMEGMMDLDVGSLNFNNGNQNNRNVVGGPRFSDKPVPVKPTDEGEKKMRNALVGLFAEEELGRDGHQDEDGDVEMESNERTINQEKLNKILLDLNECVSLGGSGSDSTSIPNLNLVIDDHGHTTLHWATALSKLNLISILVSQPTTKGGSNPNSGNYAGETPLQRSVLVTNSYESSSFPKILELLKDSFETRDFRKRTILHHISLVAGQKGRAAAAVYYLKCSLEILEKKYRNQEPLILEVNEKGKGKGKGKGKAKANRSNPSENENENENASGIRNKGFQDFINAQDDDGETALGTVSRIGNSLMIKLLLQFGARKDLVNVFGIKADDWSLDENKDPVTNNSNGELQETTTKEFTLGVQRPVDIVNALIPPPKGPIGKSRDAMESEFLPFGSFLSSFPLIVTYTYPSTISPPSPSSEIHSTLTELNSTYEKEMQTKSSALSLAQSHLQAATRELSSRRRLVNNAQSLLLEGEENRQRFSNLKGCLKKALGVEITQDLDGKDDGLEKLQKDLNEKIPIEEEFQLPNEVLNDKNGAEELIRVRWINEVLEGLCRDLEQRAVETDEESKKKELNCKRVVAACCNVRMESVEGVSILRRLG